MCDTCCMAWTALSIIVSGLVFSLVLSSMDVEDNTTNTINDEDQRWPFRDKNGFIMAHKEAGRWVNWWHRNKPGFAGIFRFFFLSEDNSGVPVNNEEELRKVLPVKAPFWTKNETTHNETAFPANSRLTWLGHATVLAEIDSIVLLTDPIFSQRASASQWFGPKRYRPAPCSVNELPDRIDGVLISHSHYDHLDLNSVRQISDKYGEDIQWFVPSGLRDWMTDNGVGNNNNIHEMIWWEEKRLKDAKIVFTPSNHWSRRSAFDANKVLWGSWTVIGPRHKFFFAGDTAYQNEAFKQIRQKYGNMDMAALPIGAYEPRWFMKWVHVSPEEAIKIHQDLGTVKSLAIHWGTFKLTYEPFMEPKQKLSEALAAKNISEDAFVYVNHGESVNL